MLDFILMVFEWIIMAVILAVFSLFPLIGMYLMWEGFRDLVHDFQRWALKRLFKRKIKRNSLRNHIVLLPSEPERKNLSIYDQMIEEQKDAKRLQKEIEARDQDTIDRATEYHNDLSK